MTVLVWLAIDSTGTIHGPFDDLFMLKRGMDYRAPAPLTLMQVPRDDKPVFLAAGDRLAATIHNMIFNKRTEKREAFNRRVDWAAES